MSIALPDALLNPLNKELKGRCEALLEEQRRHAAVARLEAETAAGTQRRVDDARQRQRGLQRALEAAEARLQRTEQEAQLAGRVASTGQQLLRQRRGDAADVSERTAAVTQRVDVAREQLEAAEAEGAQLEQAVLDWIKENRAAEGATGAARAVFDDGAAAVQRMQRQAEAATASIRKLTADVDEERIATDTVRREAADIAQSTVAAEAEVLQLQRRIEEAAQRQEEIAALETIRADARTAGDRAVLDAMDAARSAKEVLAKMQADAARAAIVETREVRGRDGIATQLRDVEAAVEALGKEVVLRERALGIARSRTAALTAERDATAQQLRDAEAKHGRAAVKHSSLEAALAQHRLAVDEAQGDDDVAGRVLEDHRREHAALDALARRGVELIQQQATRQAAIAQGTQRHGEALQRLQRQREEQERAEAAASAQLAALTAAAAEMQAAIDDREAAVAASLATQQERSVEERQRKRQRIEQLEAELAAVEQQHRDARAAVTSVTGALRGAQADAAAADAGLAGLQDDLRAEAAELERILSDQRQLGARRADAVEARDALGSRLDMLRARAEAEVAGVADQEALRRELALEGRVKLSEIDVRVAAAQAELNAVEEERRRLAQRRNEAEQQARLLRSRHDDVVTAMSDAVNLEAAEASRIGAGNPSSTAAGAGALVVAKEELLAGEVTPEDLQARLLLLRGAERDELQRRGDALDQAIVRAERDTRGVEQALDLLRRTPDRDVVDAVARDDPEEAEVQRVLDDARRRFADDTAGLSAEVGDAEARLRQLQEHSAHARAAEAEARAQLAAAVDERTAWVAQLRAAEREEQRAAATTAQARVAVRNAGAAVRTRHEALVAKPGGAAALAAAATEDAVDRGLQRLADVTARCPGGLAALHLHCRRFGLVAPTPCAARPVSATTAPSRCASRGRPSTAAPTPSSVRRPATQALVTAMASQRPRR